MNPPSDSRVRAVAFRLEIARMVLFALLLMSAFLASMAHVSDVSSLKGASQGDSDSVPAQLSDSGH